MGGWVGRAVLTVSHGGFDACQHVYKIYPPWNKAYKMDVLEYQNPMSFYRGGLAIK